MAVLIIASTMTTASPSLGAATLGDDTSGVSGEGGHPSGGSARRQNAIVPEDFFGLHLQRVIRRPRITQTSNWPDLSFGTWRLWDTGVPWALMEPADGKWDFGQLDQCVQAAARHGVSILMPLGLTPRWAASRPDEPSAYSPGVASEPRDFKYWVDFVQTLGARYRGRIRAYEVWNEPNLKPFFSGRPEALLQLSRSAYATLKSIDSTTVVVSPAATGGEAGVAWLDKYLSLGGGKYCDVVGFHLYTGGRPPEAMVNVCESLSRVIEKHGLAGKPVWNTEAGWEIPDVPVGGKMAAQDSVQQAKLAAYVCRALILAWWGGMDRFYWYAWDNYKFGLVNADGVTEKPAALAYRLTRDWLVGRRMVACQEDSSGVWTVKLVSENGDASWVRWSVRGPQIHKVEASEAGLMVTDLRGRSSPVAALSTGGGLTIDESPVLLSAAATR